MSLQKTAHNLEGALRTGDVQIEESVDFAGLLLSAPVQEGLSKAGFVRPSPIQLKAIPLGRCGLDLVVQAKSGTGKTCVFTVVALEGLILDTSATQVIVLAPTREIAVQIWEVITSIGSCLPKLRCYTFIGGMPLSDDKQKLKKCHIAVGTPGRVKQLIEQQALRTENVRLFVLDEADKLMEDSFQDQINWIYSAMPENKQMLALSATYPEVLANHITAYMRNPTFVRLNTSDPALLGIRQYMHVVPFHPLPQKQFDQKTKALLHLLSSVSFHQCLVFSNYQMRAQNLSDLLNAKGWPASYISGAQPQQDRMAAMVKLKQMECRVLISTDLTSRGIDAEHVNMVVNLDIPKDNETYLHRIGRAGRFGTYGAGVTFAAVGKELEDLKRIEVCCSTNIQQLPDPIPADLAQSSGFVSLDHLVTTETIVTRDGKNHYVPVKYEQTDNHNTVTTDSTNQDTGNNDMPNDENVTNQGTGTSDFASSNILTNLGQGTSDLSSSNILANQDTGTSDTPSLANQGTGTSDTPSLANQDTGTSDTPSLANQDTGTSDTPSLANQDTGTSDTPSLANQDTGTSDTPSLANQDTGTSDSPSSSILTNQDTGTSDTPSLANQDTGTSDTPSLANQDTGTSDTPSLANQDTGTSDSPSSSILTNQDTGTSDTPALANQGTGTSDSPSSSILTNQGTGTSDSPSSSILTNQDAGTSDAPSSSILTNQDAGTSDSPSSSILTNQDAGTSDAPSSSILTNQDAGTSDAPSSSILNNQDAGTSDAPSSSILTNQDASTSDAPSSSILNNQEAGTSDAPSSSILNNQDAGTSDSPSSSILTYQGTGTNDLSNGNKFTSEGTDTSNSPSSQAGRVKDDNVEDVSDDAANPPTGLPQEILPSSRPHDDTNEGAQEAMKDSKTVSKPKRKVNNIWTSLSFSYRDECKALDQERAKLKAQRKVKALPVEKPISKTASSGNQTLGDAEDVLPSQTGQSEGRGPEMQSTPDLPTSNTCRSPVTSSSVRDQSQPTDLVGQGRAASHTVINIKLPSVAALRGHPPAATGRSFTNILTDYETFMQATTTGDQPPMMEVKPSLDTKTAEVCQRYVADVSRLLKDLAVAKDMNLEVIKVSREQSASSTSQIVTNKNVSNYHPTHRLSSLDSDQARQTQPEIAGHPQKLTLGTCNHEEFSLDSELAQRSQPKPLSNAQKQKSTTSRNGKIDVQTNSPPVKTVVSPGQSGRDVPPRRGVFTGGRVGREKNKLGSRETANPYGNWIPCEPKESPCKEEDVDSEWSDTSEDEGLTDEADNRNNRFFTPVESKPSQHSHNHSNVKVDGKQSRDWVSSTYQPGADAFYDYDCYQESRSSDWWTGRDQSVNPNVSHDPWSRNQTADTAFSGQYYSPPNLDNYPLFDGRGESDWSRGYWEGVAAAQSCHMAAVAYQHYVMHWQYANYYKGLFEAQQRQQQLHQKFQAQKKYIRTMAKWMAQQNIKP